MAKKNGKAKKVKASKVDKTKLVNEKIEELMIARREHSMAMIEWDEAHAHAGELKKTMERKQALLNSIVLDIEQIRAGNYTPPLPFGEEAKEATESPAPAMQRQGLWRDVPMSDVINGAVLKKLEEADVATIGAYADTTAAGKKIPGIGPAASESIENAMIEFWKSHPEFCECENSEPISVAVETNDGK